MAHIVAVGLRTPVGLMSASAAAAVRAGICRVREHPFLLDPAGRPLRTAYDGALDPQLLGWPRILALAEAGLRQVLTVLRSCSNGHGASFWFALPEPRPGFGEREKQHVLDGLSQLAQRAGWPLPAGHFTSGQAGGLDALRRGWEAICDGSSELSLVAGADSYLDADTIQWLGASRQLATTATRSAFFPGEGAGFVVLMSDRLRQATRLPSLAWIRGAAVTPAPVDASPGLELGLGLTDAIRAAARDLDPGKERIHRVLCDINGERARSEAWGFATLRLHELFVNAGTYEAPAGSWGDLGAATGIALAALAIHGWQRQVAPGPLSLLIARSQGGTHGAVILQEGERR